MHYPLGVRTLPRSGLDKWFATAIPAGAFFTIATSLPYRSGAGGAVAPADAALSTYLFWFSIDGEGTPPRFTPPFALPLPGVWYAMVYIPFAPRQSGATMRATRLPSEPARQRRKPATPDECGLSDGAGRS